MTNFRLSWVLARVVIYASLIGLSLMTIVPFVLAVIVSFSEEKSILMNGYQFIPKNWSLDAYKLIFQDSMIYTAYKNTLVVTMIGTALSLFISAMLGYVLSVQKVKYRNHLAFFIFIPMVFNAGLVPWYLVSTNVLHLKNSLLSLILPMLVNPFYLFLLRNYFKTIPPSLAESAEIDGASPRYIFIKIIFPLAMPILATVGLFTTLGYWNDFTMSLWFIEDRGLYTLQFLLYRITSMINFLQQNGQVGSANVVMPSESIVFATFLIALGPIVLVYPFLQKYFVKGIMIGAIKG